MHHYSSPLLSIGFAAAALLLGACAEDDSSPTGKSTGPLTCTPLYIVEDGSAGTELNELWPNDGGIYCAENVNSDGCVGNYCGENEGWTTDPQLGAPPAATCTTLYVIENGHAGTALNELWPNDGGIYCAENVNSDGCIGNYCGEDKGWTKDPQFQAPAPAACTTLYVIENGRAGTALNELWPNDGGIYCAENVNSDGCIGNYCGEDEGWTKDPQFQAPPTATCTTLYVIENGHAGTALNELWPNDGGIYCAENVNSYGCVGNYCGENKGWTTDPSFGSK
jgi:hypothetical protein